MKKIVPVLAALLMAGCSSEPAQPDGTTTGTTAPSEQVDMDGDTAAGSTMNKQSYGDPDRDFASMMIPHHQGAIAMAQTELRKGKDPEMQALARKIISDQEREIAQLRRWLERPPQEVR